MHVQKTNAYASATALLNHIAANADRGSANNRLNAVEPVNKADNRNSGSSARYDRHVAKEVAPTKSEIPNSESGYRMLLHPSLDRRVKSALESYNTLQNQTNYEEQDTVSRLLGVDLYV